MNKDLEESIAEASSEYGIRDGYGDTMYTIHAVEIDDLRTWMRGHVRVPVESPRNLTTLIEEYYALGWSDGQKGVFGDSRCPDATEKRKEIISLLTASKEPL